MGKMNGVSLVSYSCVACKRKSCLSRAVCSSMRFCSHFFEIRLVELCLLLIAVPWDLRGLSRGDRGGAIIGCLVVLSLGNVLLFVSSCEGSTIGRCSDIGVRLELV